MAPHIRRGNASRSSVRAAVEHVFAHQKGSMGLFIRTIGLARARAKVGMANIAYAPAGPARTTTRPRLTQPAPGQPRRTPQSTSCSARIQRSAARQNPRISLSHPHSR